MENLNKKSWLSENVKSILIVVWFIVLWIIIRMLGLIFKRWPLYFILHWLNNDVPYEKSQNIESNNITFSDTKNKDSSFEEKETSEINDSVIPFEKKEKCMKYFDKYKDSLKRDWETDDDQLFTRIFDYEMFYYPELDTCISMFTVQGAHIFKDGRYTFHSYHIVDYLNWEKTLWYGGHDSY